MTGYRGEVREYARGAFYFLIIITGSIILQTCKPEKCVPPPDEYRYISHSVLLKVPYKNYAELTFINSISKDTDVFTGQGWDSTFLFVPGSEECRRGTFFEQRIQNFSSPTHPQSINFGITFPDHSSEYLTLDMLANKYYLWSGNIVKPYEFDSLLIQNKVYYDVKYFKNQYQTRFESKYGCYYNTTFGILKIELPEGDLELIKLKN